MQIERLVAHGGDAGNDDRHVVGPAARHDGVDGDALDGRAPVRGRDLGDELVAAAPGGGDGGGDAGARRRHHGQTVGDAARVEILEIVEGVAHDRPGYSRRAARTAASISR